MNRTAGPGDDGASGQRTSFPRLMGVVARRDYVRTVKRRGFIVGTLLLPLGLMALFGLSAILKPASDAGIPGAGGTRIVIVNDSSVDLRSLALAPAISLVTREAAEQALASGELDEFYLIPATWPARPDITRVQPTSGGFSLDTAQRHQVQDELLYATLRSGLLLARGVGSDVITRVIAPATVTTVTVGGTQVSDAAMAASLLLPFGFTLLFVMSIFITSGYLLQSVTEEKENRVVEILLSSVPSLPLMAGKILGLGASGLTQVLIWVGASLVLLPVIGGQLGGLGDLHVSPPVLLLGLVYFVLGYLSFGAIFTAIGAVAPGNREAQQYFGLPGLHRRHPARVQRTGAERPRVAGGVGPCHHPADRARHDAHGADHRGPHPARDGRGVPHQPVDLRGPGHDRVSPCVPGDAAAVRRPAEPAPDHGRHAGPGPGRAALTDRQPRSDRPGR